MEGGGGVERREEGDGGHAVGVFGAAGKGIQDVDAVEVGIVGGLRHVRRGSGEGETGEFGS